MEPNQGQLYRISDGEVKWVAVRSQCRKGIEFLHAPYKLYEGAKCTNPQVHLAILAPGLFAPMGCHRLKRISYAKNLIKMRTIGIRMGLKSKVTDS